MTLKLYSLLKMLAFLVVVLKTSARPTPNADKYNLKKIFKFGEGIMVYNTGTSKEALENDEIVCAERRAGKSYCKEVENYIEATRLDKIDPAQFAKFKEYFKDDLVQTQRVTTRMDVGNSDISKVIYPEGAKTENSKWLLVVQHEQYKQGVQVEECENEENSTLPLEDISKCKQNFINRRMVVLVNGVMKAEMVKLPSTYECST